MERGYDSDGRLISERYLDRYNKLTNNAEGFAGWNGYYNGEGELVVTSRYDENRQPVNLDFIDFVRVYTGVNQVIAELGETSTEIAGAEDLHLEASIAAIQAATGIEPTPNPSPREGSYYTLDGRLVQSSKLKAQSSKGVYILRKSDGTAKKVIIK